jgi:hypothetical protein
MNPANLPVRPWGAFEVNRLEHSKVSVLGHSFLVCYGTACCLHNRSGHGMRDFRQHWREDRRIMERICEHGVGHPDPDDRRILSGADDGVHGCDGCCHEP